MNGFDLSNFRTGSLTLVWPTERNATDILTFESASEWQDFVRGFALSSKTPIIVEAKYRRALTLYELTWFAFDVIKAGELAALVALELALLNQYGADCLKRLRAVKKASLKQKRAGFLQLLQYMVEHDGLTASNLPSLHRVKNIEPILENLAEVRNGLAHGDPFDGFHKAGLIDLVRDLIDYAYRDWPSQ